MIVASAYGLWLLFLVTWWLAAFWTAKATSIGKPRSTIAYSAGFVAGFGLLFTGPPFDGVGYRAGPGFGFLLPRAWQMPLWRDPSWLGWALIAAELAAFAFAWWARLHLGRLWSGMLTLREGHRVVESGPYAVVRHPIYTGFIAASWALALIVACPPPLAGAAILTIVMTLKAGTEERLLARELGAESYAAYRRRVPMLVPFAPR